MSSVAGGVGDGMLRVDEERVRGHVDEVVRSSVEETLNGLLDAEADRLCGAERCERSADRLDTRAGSYRLLHDLGYSCLRPRPRHRKSDPEAIESFKAGWPERVKKIAAEHPGKRLRVYFQDESRFGQQGTNTNVWAKRGSRPTAVRQTEYQRLWGIGAVCPESGHAEGLLSPRLDTKIVNTFLERFSATVPAGEHAVMVWDGAGFHTAKR